MKTFLNYRGHNLKLLKKNLNKSAILNFFSAIIELVWELVFSNMPNINKFRKDTWKTSFCAHNVKLLT